MFYISIPHLFWICYVFYCLKIHISFCVHTHTQFQSDARHIVTLHVCPEVAKPPDWTRFFMRICVIRPRQMDRHTLTCFSSLRGIHVLSLSVFLSLMFLTFFFFFPSLPSHAHEEVKFVRFNIRGSVCMPKSLSLSSLSAILLREKWGKIMWGQSKLMTPSKKNTCTTNHCR